MINGKLKEFGDETTTLQSSGALSNLKGRIDMNLITFSVSCHELISAEYLISVAVSRMRPLKYRLSHIKLTYPAHHEDSISDIYIYIVIFFY